MRMPIWYDAIQAPRLTATVAVARELLVSSAGDD